ncbi:lipopolysaccharide heptosyltransferase I [Burkholderiales bacterium]|nr:lipopolysaccharide heptosyltransferase I [Burkholderiales bacterium]
MTAPKRILIVKTSSLGDVIHNFPMVSDIAAKFPDSKIDWLVEEDYVPLVKLHLGVERIIPIALRRWRKSIFSSLTWKELKNCIVEIRKYRYDLIIDSQGLIKSAIFARLAKGVRCGFGPRYSREKLAGMSYDIGIGVHQEQHMLERCRKLASLALNYQITDKPDYGLITKKTAVLEKKNVIIFCSSAQSKKLWPTGDWIRLCKFLSSNGFTCQFTWGNPDEYAICKHIISASSGELLPNMPINDIAAQINRSCLVVGLDTGLLHLATALEVPTIAIFGASDPIKTGPQGNGIIKICGSKNYFPSSEEVESAIAAVSKVIN